MRRGFTLVEVLLVLAILAIVTATTMPSFVRSMRANRLRGAARTVVSAGRYARSLAVVRQQPMQLVFDLARGRLRVEPAPAPPAPGEPDMPRDAARDTSPLPAPTDTPATNAPRGGFTGAETIERALDGVRVESVEIGGGLPATGGSEDDSGPIITYQTNGRCPPYVVKLADEQGRGLTVRVDALAGAEIEGEL